MADFEITERRPIQRLPGGGDGWWATVTVSDAGATEEFNVAVSDRTQDMPDFEWIERQVREVASDQDRSPFERLRERQEPHEGLDHPIVWL